MSFSHKINAGVEDTHLYIDPKGNCHALWSGDGVWHAYFNGLSWDVSKVSDDQNVFIDKQCISYDYLGRPVVIYLVGNVLKTFVKNYENWESFLGGEILFADKTVLTFNIYNHRDELFIGVMGESVSGVQFSIYKESVGLWQNLSNYATLLTYRPKKLYAGIYYPLSNEDLIQYFWIGTQDGLLESSLSSSSQDSCNSWIEQIYFGRIGGGSYGWGVKYASACIAGEIIEYDYSTRKNISEVNDSESSLISGGEVAPILTWIGCSNNSCTIYAALHSGGINTPLPFSNVSEFKISDYNYPPITSLNNNFFSPFYDS